MEENVWVASLPKKKQHHNVLRQPLFSMIPLHHVVVDKLHPFLRVSDVLINGLIADLLAGDALDKSKKIAGLSRSKHKHIAAFEEFLSKIGISGFQLLVGSDSKVNWTMLTGTWCVNLCV